MTSVGRFTCAIVCAIVKVLPEPVTPSSTWCVSPRSSPSTSSPMARCLVAGELEIGDEVEAVVQGRHENCP